MQVQLVLKKKTNEKKDSVPCLMLLKAVDQDYVAKKSQLDLERASLFCVCEAMLSQVNTFFSCENEFSGLHLFRSRQALSNE